LCTRGGVQKHAWRGASVHTESPVLAEPVISVLTVLIRKQAKFSYGDKSPVLAKPTGHFSTYCFNS